MTEGVIMPPKRSGYQSSLEKDAVRRHFDLPLLSKFSVDKGTKLAYFGMPGEECLDIRDWRAVIQEVAAVERDSRNLIPMERHLSKRFKGIRSRVYHGDVDDIILSGQGKKRTIGGQPANTEVANDFDIVLDHRVWKFDVVNLDYFGHFFPRFRENYPHARRRRPLALRRLFEQERLDARSAWLLLLTVEGGQYTDEDMDRLTQYVESTRTTENKNLSDAIDFVLSCDGSIGDPTVKLVHGAIGIFVASAASNSQLEVIPRGSVSYKGSSGQSMVHCAFQFERSCNVLGAAVDPLSLLRAPIIRPILGGKSPKFSWATPPCPGTTEQSLSKCLEFLGTDCLTPLTADVPK